MKIIVFCNQKGGVGKTTSSINIASSFAQMGYRTLLVDMDPQGNAGSGLGISKNKIEKSIYHVLTGSNDLKSVVQSTSYENLFVAPSNRDLVGAEVELMNTFARESKLKNALNSVQNDFDFCFIDCPPSLSLLTVNALTAATDVLIPVQTEYFALEGISELMHTLTLVKKNLNQQLSVTGIFLTMYDSRNNLANEVVQEVRSFFKEKTFNTIIPRNVKLSESPSHGEPIFSYDGKSRGATTYQTLAEEVHERLTGIVKGNLRLVASEG